ncbi:hypothetical protein HYZ64_02390 [Candidatus Berkelbacteria bacterium]|nr:hypothetical protein [Candidatus Berkelbacteria bacterium]
MYPKKARYNFTFPKEDYYGFWTWDRVFGAFLVAIMGALGFNWFFPGSVIAFAWNIGCISYGGAAGIHLLIHFHCSYHIKFGIFLFLSALLGGLVFLGLLISDIQSHA